MFNSKSLLCSLVIALSLCSYEAGAHPAPSSHRHSTRGLHTIGRRGLQVESYHPRSTFETFGHGHTLAKRAKARRDDPGEDLQSRACSIVATKLNLNASSVQYHSGFTSDGGIEHAYLRQAHEGIPFINAVANVAIKPSDDDDSVLSFGSSFVKPERIAPSKPTISLSAAIPELEDMFDGKYNQHLRLAYLVRPDDSAVLVYGIQIQNLEENTWYEVFVDAHTGQLVSVTDFGAKASSGTYRVVPIHKHSLADGTEVVVHPEDLEASPYGWHQNRTMLSTGTLGNNVVTWFGSNVWEGATYRTNEDEDDWEVVVFDYPYDQTAAPTTVENRDAAITNAFYVGNVVHDFAWRYGFKPLTFNFQSDTIQDKWARGDDPVWIRVQWTPGVNDATFTTPPDGQPGILRLYIWNKSNPSRDPAMANDILVHELTHGITGRLTGGGTAACLQTLEARGLGEGWSDAMAEWTEQTSAVVNDYVIGAWINNNPAGLRTYPYSTNPTTNPLRYSSLASLTTIYQIGEVWANVLHNVYAALVQAHGWASTRFTNPDTSEGNVVFMRLFFDSLSIQPCNPTFVAARDAWIQADVNRYGGSHKCLLWTAFASGGLGVGAQGYVDSAAVPADC